jgi:signal transduction histidine kinase
VSVHNAENIRDDYLIGKVLGSGAFGEVRLCTHRKTGAKRAVKIIKKSFLQGKEETRFLQEIEILNKDKHLLEANYLIQRLVLYVLGVGSVFLIALVVFFGRMGMRLRVLNKANEEKAVELLKANSALQQLYTDLKGNNKELKETLDKLSQAQEHLLRSEKMASLGILAAGVAHELNNPLNFIKGGLFTLETQAAKEGRMENPEFKHSLSIINEGINRATAILKGLGQYSRQSENKTETCDFNKILDNCLVILSNSLKYHVRVIKNFSSTPPVITGNAGKLHQAFMNKTLVWWRAH